MCGRIARFRLRASFGDSFSFGFLPAMQTFIKSEKSFTFPHAYANALYFWVQSKDGLKFCSYGDLILCGQNYVDT